MAARLCPQCKLGGGINHMKGNITQKYNITTQVPEITEWTCPYCGHKETESVPYQAEGGTYNSGIAQGPAKAPAVTPVA